jgi:hypothetical protein
MSAGGTPDKIYRWAMSTPIVLGVSYGLYKMGFRYFDEKKREKKCIRFDETLKKCTADMLFYTSTGNNRDRAKYCSEIFEAMYTYSIESHYMYPKNKVIDQCANYKARDDLLALVADTRVRLHEDKNKQ